MSGMRKVGHDDFALVTSDAISLPLANPEPHSSFHGITRPPRIRLDPDDSDQHTIISRAVRKATGQPAAVEIVRIPERAASS
jgi:hypothetical protein